MNMSAELLSANLQKTLTDIAQRAAANVSPSVRRVIGIAPGEAVAWDDCCKGQLWTRLERIENIPSYDSTRKHGIHPCAAPSFIATVELGILRCAAVMDDRGRAPAAAQLYSEGLAGLSDMAQLLATLRCTKEVRSLIGWTPRGPEGGCYGGYWSFTIEVPNCLKCEEENG